VGDFVLLEGVPCKVSQWVYFRPHKGAVKAIISGTDIWTSKKYS
jgi:hypothetical protein